LVVFEGSATVASAAAAAAAAAAASTQNLAFTVDTGPTLPVYTFDNIGDASLYFAIPGSDQTMQNDVSQFAAGSNTTNEGAVFTLDDGSSVMYAAAPDPNVLAPATSEQNNFPSLGDTSLGLHLSDLYQGNDLLLSAGGLVLNSQELLQHIQFTEVAPNELFEQFGSADDGNFYGGNNPPNT
jgi:hypothetical protein